MALGFREQCVQIVAGSDCRVCHGWLHQSTARGGRASGPGERLAEDLWAHGNRSGIEVDSDNQHGRPLRDYMREQGP